MMAKLMFVTGGFRRLPGQVSRQATKAPRRGQQRASIRADCEKDGLGPAGALIQVVPILVPYAGDVARWGAARGPAAMMQAGLHNTLRQGGHAVSEPVEIVFPRERRTRDPVTNLGIIASMVSDAVAAAIGRGTMPLVLEGNCTQAVGPAGGVARACGGAGSVWYDAHGDMHTLRTTSTGLPGGMPYAVCLGWEFADWREAAGLAVAALHGK